MEWLNFSVAAFAAASLLILPGLFASWAIGLRGLTAWASASPVSLGIITISTLWAPLAGVQWGVLPVAVTTVAILLGAGIIRLCTRPRVRTRRRIAPSVPSWAVFSALGTGAVVIVIQLVLVLREPGSISQSFDNVFHLNAVRYILESGSASPLSVGKMTSFSDGLSFYPSVWHAFVSLIVDLTGASIPVATNALIVAAAALAWPSALMLLTRTLFRMTTPIVLATGILSAASASFPLLMIDYGVLYPYFLALTVLPAVVALTLRLLNLGIDRPESTLVLVISGALMLPGLAATHPGALVAWLFVAVLGALWAWGAFLRKRPERRVLLGWSALLFVFVVFAFIAWRQLRPPAEARGWPIDRTMPQALGEVLFQGMYGAALTPVLVALLWAGVVLAWRSGQRPARLALALFALFSFLYVAAAALPWSQLRDLLTAAWYNNSPRLAALIPMVVVPLSALGAGWVVSKLIEHAARLRVPQHVRSTLVACMALILAAGTQVAGISNEVRLAGGAYAMTEDAPLLSPQEYQLLKELPEIVPPGSVIAGSPWTGAALAYALSDRDVLMRHMLTDVSPSGEIVNTQLSDAIDGDSDLCAALEETGVAYVLDFGPREVHGGAHEMAGLDHLRDSSNVELVHQVGDDARLYRVTACGVAR